MLMIGVSTGQNITNLIPAVQNRISKFLLLETATAKRAEWSDGISKVFEARKIGFETLDLTGIDSDIVAIKNKVGAEIKNHGEPIVWNLGGGQKPQQIALWEIFKERNETNKIKDVVCYANQDSKPCLEWWEYTAAGLENHPEPITVNLSAVDILTTFGYTVKLNPKTELVYQRGRNINLQKETKDLLGFKEFREYLFKLPNINPEKSDAEQQRNINDIAAELLSKQSQFEESLKNRLSSLGTKSFDTEPKLKTLVNSLRKFLIGKVEKNGKITKGEIVKLLRQELDVKNIEVQDESLKTAIGNSTIKIQNNLLGEISGFNKTAFYFEQAVKQRLKNLLDTVEHNVIEAYANLEIAKKGNESEQAAEYDLLCVTNKGTLFAFDAKTFDFERKDSDARLHNLSQAAGRYVNFYPVIPYDAADINETYFPAQLKDLPFKLKARGIPFFVISDTTLDAANWIKKNENLIEISSVKPIESDWIECRQIETAFN